MGCCVSKKDPSLCSLSAPQPDPNEPKKPISISPPIEKKNKLGAESELNGDLKREKEELEKRVSKKEVFVIQHRKSNDKRPEAKWVSDSDPSLTDPDPDSTDKPIQISPSTVVGTNLMAAVANGAVVRTSSCTKEEVDAILIQCGRLSRSSSGNGNGGSEKKRYSGSKRSYDFDKDKEVELGDEKKKGGDFGIGIGGEEEEGRRRRQSRGPHRRRSTPSRSRERDPQQRSESKERAQSGRRVSRSPGRRSESPITNCSSNSGNSNSTGNGNNGRPGKMVSVPAVEKSNNSGGGDVKRVLVRRNVGSPRSRSPARVAPGTGTSGKVVGNENNNSNNNNQQQLSVNRNVGSPRSQSPARAGQGTGICGKVVANESHNNNNQQHQPSLSRNGSRKAEQSPCRRTPLNEIDMNSLPFQPLANKKAQQKGKEIEEDMVKQQPLNCTSQNKAASQGTHRRTRSKGGDKGIEQVTDYDAMVTPVVLSATQTLNLPQTLMRSRSSRRSRDLDIEVSPTNYNSLLLQDIENFHQKKTQTLNTDANIISPSTPFTLPSCVSKACSIVEAVADLNSSTGSNPSSGFANDRWRNQNVNPAKFSFSANPNEKRRLDSKDSKDPFVESEIKVTNDLMEPSIHKYVTVRARENHVEDEESSGSNSIVGGNVNWVSSASWENSANSIDSWTSKSNTYERFSPVAFQRLAISDFAGGIHEESGNKPGVDGAKTAAAASM